MFKDVKLNIDLKKCSQKVLNKIKELFKESGILEYIYERDEYDKKLKEEMEKYLTIQFLLYVKSKYKRITLKNIELCDDWIINKIRLLAKYSNEREKFSFIIDGIIKNIHIAHNDNLFYEMMLNVFSEYCIYYDIFIDAVPMYPDPFKFTEDFTSLIQAYFEFIQNQIEKNNLKNNDLNNIIYLFVCGEQYFPLLKEEINFKLEQMPQNDKKVFGFIIPKGDENEY